jgi:Uma2 family endonuclease
VLILDEAVGGQARLTEEGYLEGVPELVAEIAGSSAAIDMGTKRHVCRRNGVPEYIVWQSYENQLEWFVLTDGEYQVLPPDADGIIRSQVFPGLWLAVEALLNNQMSRVLEVLQAGLQAEDHALFVKQLLQKNEDSCD